LIFSLVSTVDWLLPIIFSYAAFIFFIASEEPPRSGWCF
jgi:hypothetical protein